jgi:hypothetical protein
MTFFNLFFDLLKLFFDWLVLPVAVFVDYLSACLIGMIPLVVAPVAWHWTIKFLEPIDPLLGRHDFPGRPRDFSTGVIAGIAALYVFGVTATAVYHLPRTMFAIMNAAD